MFGQPSGQFSYQPVEDRSGENIARGITMAAQGISRGIQDYRDEKKKKEANEAAAFWIKTNAKKYGINVDDDGEINALVKTAGGGPQAVQMLMAVEEMKQRQAQAQMQQRIQQEQLLAAQAAAAQQARDVAAMQAATGAGESVAQFAQRGGYIQRNPAPMARAGGGAIDEQAVMTYLQRGGSPRGAGDLAQVADYLAQAKQRNTPKRQLALEEMTGPSGQAYYRQSDGSIQPVPAGRTEADAVKTVEIGGRKLQVGPGNKYFDDKGQAVDFQEDKPLSVNEFMMSPQLSTKFGDDYGKYREAFTAQKNKINKPAAESSTAGERTLEEIRAEMAKRRNPAK